MSYDALTAALVRSEAEVKAELTRLRTANAALAAALLKVARMAEALKRDCGMDPESPQAIRNGQYMAISYAARAAIKEAEQ